MAAVESCEEQDDTDVAFVGDDVEGLCQSEGFEPDWPNQLPSQGWHELRLKEVEIYDDSFQSTAVVVSSALQNEPAQETGR